MLRIKIKMIYVRKRCGINLYKTIRLPLCLIRNRVDNNFSQQWLPDITALKFYLRGALKEKVLRHLNRK